MENPVNSFLQIKQQDIQGLKVINEPLFDAIMDALAAIQVYSTENSVNMSVEDVENVLSPKKTEIAEAIVELPEEQPQQEPKEQEIKEGEAKDTQVTEQAMPEEIGTEKLIPVSALNGFELGKKYRFKTLDELKSAGVKSAKGREYLLGKEILFDPKDLDWLNNRFRKVYYLDTKKYFNLDNPNGDNEWSLSFDWVWEVVPATESAQIADEDEDELSPVEQFKQQKSQSGSTSIAPPQFIPFSGKFEKGKTYMFQGLTKDNAGPRAYLNDKPFTLNEDVLKNIENYYPGDNGLDILQNRLDTDSYIDSEIVGITGGPRGDNTWIWSDIRKYLYEYEKEGQPPQTIAKITPKIGKVKIKKSKSNRPSPSQSAAATPIGTKMKGNDGNMYIVKQNIAGVKQWKLYKK